MRQSSLYAAIIGAALSTASPTATHPKRALASSCDQYGSTTSGQYTLYNDLWGESAGTGNQCYTLDSASPLGWTSTWSWSGGPNSVKSYANVVYSGYTPTMLSKLPSIPTSWSWSYTGSSIVADVSYDLFTSSTATGSNEYEIMVWLAALGGAGPIASSYGADGKPVAVGQMTAGGVTFNLYAGSNGVQKQTYSFVATAPAQSWSGDLNVFLQYLVKNENFDASQYLVSLGAGTEAFTGSNAVFKVSSFSVAVGGTSATSSAPATVPSSTAKTTVTTATSKPTTSVTSVASPTSKPATTTTKATSTAAAPTAACAAKYAQCGGQGFTGPTCCSGSTCVVSNQWYSQCT